MKTTLISFIITDIQLEAHLGVVCTSHVGLDNTEASARGNLKGSVGWLDCCQWGWVALRWGQTDAEQAVPSVFHLLPAQTHAVTKVSAKPLSTNNSWEPHPAP